VPKPFNITLLTVLCVALSLLSKPLWADNNKVTVLMDDTYPPYMYKEHSQNKGLYPQLVAAIFEEAQIPAEIKSIPWKRAIILSKESSRAIGGLYKNEKRLSIYDFSDPIYTEQLWVYTKPDSNFTFQQLSDLKGKRAALNLGWSYGAEFDKLRAEGVFTIEEYGDNHSNLIKLISLPRIDYTLMDEVAAQLIMTRHDLHQKVKRISPPAIQNKAYIAFSKSSRQLKTLQAFNQALKRLRSSGKYQKIVEDFLNHPSQNDIQEN